MADEEDKKKKVPPKKDEKPSKDDKKPSKKDKSDKDDSSKDDDKKSKPFGKDNKNASKDDGDDDKKKPFGKDKDAKDEDDDEDAPVKGKDDQQQDGVGLPPEEPEPQPLNLQPLSPQVEINPTLKTVVEELRRKVSSYPMALREDAARELVSQVSRKKER